MSPLSLTTVRKLRFVLAALTFVTGVASTTPGAQGPPPTTDVVISPDGVRISYETAGDGTPALVFVHGWSCDRSYWEGQLPAFSQQFKVVAVDLAGHGESGSGRKAWTIASFGGDVAAVVEKLRLKRAVLIGHSMGGDVIVEAARRLPGRVAGLIWVDTYKQLRTVRNPVQIQAFVAPFRKDFVEATRGMVRGMFPAGADQALVERVAMDMSAAPPAVAIAALEAAIGFDREVPKALQELKLPVVAINPDAPPTDVESLKRYGVEVVVMPGVGHFLMMEDADRFNGLLKAAVEKLAR